MSAFKTGQLLVVDCIYVNILVVILYCSYASCNPWGKLGESTWNLSVLCLITACDCNFFFKINHLKNASRYEYWLCVCQHVPHKYIENTWACHFSIFSCDPNSPLPWVLVCAVSPASDHSSHRSFLLVYCCSMSLSPARTSPGVE